MWLNVISIMRAFDISFYFKKIVGFELVLQLYTWWDSENHFRTYLIMTMVVASSQRRYISDSANEMRVTKCGENCQTLNSLWQPELTSGASAPLSPSNFARTKRNWCALNPSATSPGTETKRTVNYRAPLFSAYTRGRAANEFSRQINLRQQKNYHRILRAKRSCRRWRISQVENRFGRLDIMSLFLINRPIRLKGIIGFPSGRRKWIIS